MSTSLDDSVVVRRLGSEKTHVAQVGDTWRAFFIKPYWAPLGGATAACGVKVDESAVIMATGAKVKCQTCVHLTGITEQSPAVRERLEVAS